jgi:hypothetical protein
VADEQTVIGTGSIGQLGYSLAMADEPDFAPETVLEATGALASTIELEP